MTFTCPDTSPSGDRCHNTQPHDRGHVHWAANGSDVADRHEERPDDQ